MTVAKQVDHTLTDFGGKQPSAQALLKAGDKISHYEISRELGRGGMGAVYLAKHGTIDVHVAIKILPPAIAFANPDAAARFIREARLAANLVHPNVIKMIDCGKDKKSNIFYLVQEFVEGGSVKDKLANGPIPETEALEWLVQIAGALQAADLKKIIHRDIKPDNILLTADGEAKLADLGLAKDLTSSTAHLTQSNVGIGTPAYMSPEQISDAKNVDARSDIYSLGATFFHMVTGRAPYMGASVMNILNKVINEPVPNPADLNPKLSPFLARVCMKMIQKDPALRYQSPEELLRALAAGEAPAEFNTTSIDAEKKTPSKASSDQKFVSHAQSRVGGDDKFAPIAVASLLVLALILGGAVFMLFGEKDAVVDDKDQAKESSSIDSSGTPKSGKVTENPPTIEPVETRPIQDPPLPTPEVKKEPKPDPTEEVPVPVKKTPAPAPKAVNGLDPNLLKGLRFAVGFNKQTRRGNELLLGANHCAEDLPNAQTFAVRPNSVVALNGGRKTVYQGPRPSPNFTYDFKTRTIAFWAKSNSLHTAVIVDSGANNDGLKGLNLGIFGGRTYGKWRSIGSGFFLGLWQHDFLLPVSNEDLVDRWHFIALAVGEGTFRIMLDGVLPNGYEAAPGKDLLGMRQPFPRPARFEPRTNAGLRIGGPNSLRVGLLGRFQGFIDDVAIWDRPLSTTELTAIYEFSKGGSSYCEALEELKR